MRFRRCTLLIICQAVLVAVFSLAGSPRAAENTAPAQTVTTIAVMDFDNRSSSGEWGWLSKGLADMVVTDLSASSSLVVLERERLTEILRELDLGATGLVDASRAARVGEIARVDRVLFGSFLKDGDTLKIEAHLLDLKTQELLRVEWVEGRADEVFKLEKQLVEQILARLDVPLTEEERHSLDYVPTDSIPAFEHYSRSLAYFDNGQWHEALLECRLAVSHDPQYLMAAVRLADLYRQLDQPEHAVVEYRRLIEADRENVLPESMYYNMGRLLEELGEHAQALEAYERVLVRHPDYTTIFDSSENPEPAERFAVREAVGHRTVKRHQAVASANEVGLRTLERVALIHSAAGEAYKAAQFYSQIISLIRQNGIGSGSSYLTWDDLQHRVLVNYRPLYWRFVAENRDADLCPLEPVMRLSGQDAILTSEGPIPADAKDVFGRQWWPTVLAPADQEFADFTFAVDCGSQDPKGSSPMNHTFIEWREPGTRRNTGYTSSETEKFDVEDNWRSRHVELALGARALRVRIGTEYKWRLVLTLRPWSGTSPRQEKAPFVGGRISVRFDPEEAAELWLDGDDHTYGAPVKGRLMCKIPPGDHVVKAVWPDGRHASERVNVEEGKTVSVLISLEKTGCVLSRSTLPAKGSDTYLFRDMHGTVWLLWDTAVYDYNGPTPSEESDLFCSTSTDGVKWTEPRKLSLSSSVLDMRPILQQDPRGAYWLVWCSSRDTSDRNRLWISRSDDGLKWSFPRKINLPGMAPDDLLYWHSTARVNYAFAIDSLNRFWIRVGSMLYRSEDGNQWTVVSKMDVIGPVRGGALYPNLHLAFDSENNVLTCSRISKPAEGPVLTDQPGHLWKLVNGAKWKDLGPVTDIEPYWVSMTRDTSGRILFAISQPEYFKPRYENGRIRGGQIGPQAVFLRTFDERLGWSQPVAVERWPHEPFHASVAALGDGRAVIAYSCQDGITTVVCNPPLFDKEGRE